MLAGGLHILRPGQLHNRVTKDMYCVSWRSSETCNSNESVNNEGDCFCLWGNAEHHASWWNDTTSLAATRLELLNAATNSNSDFLRLIVHLQGVHQVATGNLLQLVQHFVMSTSTKVHLMLFHSTSDQSSDNMCNAGLTGLAAVCNAELQSRVQCICCELDSLSANLVPIQTDLKAESMVKFASNGTVNQVGRLQRYLPIAVLNDASILQSVSRGQMMVTGGTGAIGLLVAQWIAARQSERFMLLSRSGAVAYGAHKNWHSISNPASKNGTRVQQCNISDPRAVSHVLHLGGECLNSVVHCAGVLADALFTNQTQASLNKVWAPKSFSAWCLHTSAPVLEAGTSLDAFVMFSSAAALFGSQGQANYAAANAALDELVHTRSQLGLAGVSVQWGAWAGSGMAVQSGTVSRMKEEHVSISVEIPQEHALCALELAISYPQQAVCAMVPVQWYNVIAAGVVPPLLEQLAQPYLQQVSAQDQATVMRVPKPDTQNQLFEGMSSDLERATHVENIVHNQVSKLVNGNVELDIPLMDSGGLDSMAAIELRDQLSRTLNLPLPAVVLFDYPSVARLASHLDTLLFKDDVCTIDAVMPQAHIVQQDHELSVASFACALPGSCATIAQCWHLFSTGRDAICSVPSGRWNTTDHSESQNTNNDTTNKCYIQQGGFVTGLEEFDANFFRISTSEAQHMDPQQRCTLEVNQLPIVCTHVFVCCGRSATLHFSCVGFPSHH